MNKKLKRLFAGLLATALALSGAGCGQNSDENAVLMNYATGIGENGEYNSELYGMNCVSDVDGADPSVIYVSEEESAEYGGYYYMYVTGYIQYQNEESKDGIYAYHCYRSKDLYNWENAGALQGGYALQVEEDDWCWSDFWAPEVIQNPADGKYYMYFNAGLHSDYGVEGLANTSTQGDKIYLGVAVSDGPTGPFDVINDVDQKTGKKVPTINFQTGCNLDAPFPVIDASPFFDDDGQFYLYFKAEPNSYREENGTIFGMKMNSMEYPDYSTVTALVVPDYAQCANVAGELTGIKGYGAVDRSEGGVNEGPFMFKHNGKYYLTYSSEGYTSSSYSVWQAVSDTPLSGFKKLSFAEGNPVLDGTIKGYMAGTGHHCFVTCGEEMFIVYHRHTNAEGWSNSGGRVISADRVSFVENASGDEVLVVNGPSTILTWLPETVSGYANLAQTANISTDNGSGIEYLTDGIIPYATVTEYMVADSEEGDVTITLSWDSPVEVSSVMIYNSGYSDTAFSKISRMKFKLAEKPDWASKDYTYAVIKNLEFPSDYYDESSNAYVACAPAVAEFDSITVTEIQITISGYDRLSEFDKQGNKNQALELSEIVVLGGVK